MGESDLTVESASPRSQNKLIKSPGGITFDFTVLSPPGCPYVLKHKRECKRSRLEDQNICQLGKEGGKAKAPTESKSTH